MSNNQNHAKLKATIAEFVGPLLRRLKLAEEKVSEKKEMAEIIEQIRTEVKKRKDSLDNRQNRDWDLTGFFGEIERQIDSWIDHNEKLDEMDDRTVTNTLKDIHQKLSEIPIEKPPDLSQEAETTEVTESSNRSYPENEMSMDLKKLEELDVHSINCLYSLGIFPLSKELEKRFLIYWWIGLGLLTWTSWKQAKDCGNKIYYDLMNKGFLKSVHIEKHDQLINRCTINPTVHKWLSEKNVIFSFDRRTHFSSPFSGDLFNEKVLINLNKKYLNSDNICINNNLQVVLLGNWWYTEIKVDNKSKETGPEKSMSIDHIEIDSTDVLKNLGEKTTYLSLQGISGIEEIHESIGKLENLMILDLRACHNLIKLPQKARSTLKQKLLRWKLPQQGRIKKLIGRELPKDSWFNKLMVLDISGCYLLDHMPKWICELSNLEVIKGFVVGSVGNKNQSCQLGDLSKLNNLKKLSIRTAIDILNPEVFRGFNSLDNLLILTITLGEHKHQEIPTYSLPKNLEKLDIRCYSEVEASKLMKHDQLTNLKRLYIRGGNLTKIPCNDNWKVKILRLRFLNKLVPTKWEDVRKSFKNLEYVEYVGCCRPENFPNDGCSWSKEKDEPSQSANSSEASN